jgi:hypothetical protein
MPVFTTVATAFSAVMPDRALIEPKLWFVTLPPSLRSTPFPSRVTNGDAAMVPSFQAPALRSPPLYAAPSSVRTSWTQ